MGSAQGRPPEAAAPKSGGLSFQRPLDNPRRLVSQGLAIRTHSWGHTASSAPAPGTLAPNRDMVFGPSYLIPHGNPKTLPHSASGPLHLLGDILWVKAPPG